MPEKIYTLDEIEKDITTNRSTRVCLMDSKNKRLVAWNSQKTTLAQRWDDVKARLNSRATPDGIYQIHAKHHGNNVEPLVYYYQKGNLSASTFSNGDLDSSNVNNLNPAPIIDFDQNHTISNKEYLETKTELIAARAANNVLENENAELKIAIKELEEMLNEEINEEENNSFLSDSQSWLKDAVPQVIPILSEFMEIQRQKVAVKAMQLNPNLIPKNNEGYNNTNDNTDFENSNGHNSTIQEEENDY